ncbi:MAG: xynZ 2 [Verrucomicrobiales bacterium]|nr:xynZ 2 [Verrucomicrobiales bacterium]
MAVTALAQETKPADPAAAPAATPGLRQPQFPPQKYPRSPDSVAQEGVPHGKLEGPFIFKSQVFEGTIRKYWIYVPAQYDAAKPACVLIFQDGHRAQNTNGVLRLPIVMDNLIAKKEMPVTVGIFITPGAKGVEDYDYINSKDANNRSVEYDSLGDKYAKFLLEEMLPEVGKKYNLTKDPEGRAIGGTSSGAICAFNVAWERPDQFRKVISCIGSFTNIKGGHVYPKRILETEKKPIRVFIEDTLHDNPRPDNPERDWHLQNIAMVDALKAKGYAMDYAFEEGTHSDNHGGSIMPQMLKWLWLDYKK